MTKKEYVLKASINAPQVSLEIIEKKYDILVEKGYIKPKKAKKELSIKVLLPDMFKTEILEDNNFLLKLKEDHNVTQEFFKEEMNKFLAYRTEKSTNGKKERWEKEKVFEVKRRFITWIGNNKGSYGSKQQKKITTI